MSINLIFCLSLYSSEAHGFVTKISGPNSLGNEVLVFKYVQLVLEVEYVGFNVSEWQTS